MAPVNSFVRAKSYSKCTNSTEAHQRQRHLSLSNHKDVLWEYSHNDCKYADKVVTSKITRYANRVKDMLQQKVAEETNCQSFNVLSNELTVWSYSYRTDENKQLAEWWVALKYALVEEIGRRFRNMCYLSWSS